MLKINLSPVRQDRAPLIVNYTAPVLTVDGIEYDLSEIPDKATVQHPVIQNCTRTGNNFELTLTMPHGANAPMITRFPEPIIVTEDGDISLPFYDEERI